MLIHVLLWHLINIKEEDNIRKTLLNLYFHIFVYSFVSNEEKVSDIFHDWLLDIRTLFEYNFSIRVLIICTYFFSLYLFHLIRRFKK
jgi:hypothetical protein